MVVVVAVAMIGCVRSCGLSRGDGCQPSPPGDTCRSLSDGQHLEVWSFCAVNWLVFSSASLGTLEVTMLGEPKASLPQPPGAESAGFRMSLVGLCSTPFLPLELASLVSRAHLPSCLFEVLNGRRCGMGISVLSEGFCFYLLTHLLSCKRGYSGGYFMLRFPDCTLQQAC